VSLTGDSIINFVAINSCIIFLLRTSLPNDIYGFVSAVNLFS